MHQPVSHAPAACPAALIHRVKGNAAADASWREIQRFLSKFPISYAGCGITLQGYSCYTFAAAFAMYLLHIDDWLPAGVLLEVDAKKSEFIRQGLKRDVHVSPAQLLQPVAAAIATDAYEVIDTQQQLQQQ